MAAQIVKKFWLCDNAHEDEAQATGIEFVIYDDGTALVSETFNFEEYAKSWANPTVMPVEEARARYKRVLAEGDYSAFEFKMVNGKEVRVAL